MFSLNALELRCDQLHRDLFANTAAARARLIFIKTRLDPSYLRLRHSSMPDVNNYGY
jgi:hypothetical protein